jgi:molybdopterin molybdotransferase
LAQTITAGFDMPQFDNSAMDGFAIRSSDLIGADRENPVTLAVVGDIPAGVSPSLVLQTGHAARIVTGAVVPEGADAVIPVEDTNLGMLAPGSSLTASIQLYRAVAVGANIRPRGQDVNHGDRILASNIRLGPQEIGALAMLGISDVEVYRQPRVGLFSSGDELTPVGEPLEPGKIYESNAYTLDALLTQNGGISIPLGTSKDHRDAVKSVFDRAVDQNVDLILSSAGVSMGAFDFVRTVLEEDGELDFWRVNMKPGKPLAFGHYRGIPFIGLPGNPVSAYVGFEVFVRPVLAKLSGLPFQPRESHQVVLSEAVRSDGRESYLRAVVTQTDGEWRARLTGHQGSGNFLSLVQANALIIIPAGVESLPAGARVDAWRLR